MWEFIKRFQAADRDVLAALFSIIPGLGHLYKHHYLAGFGILVGGNLLVAYVSILLGLATFGVSLLVLPLVYVVAVGASAYSIPDWHGHHGFLHPWRAKPDTATSPDKD
jgi:hypothetical protein